MRAQNALVCPLFFFFYVWTDQILSFSSFLYQANREKKWSDKSELFWGEILAIFRSYMDFTLKVFITFVCIWTWIYNINLSEFSLAY